MSEAVDYIKGVVLDELGLNAEEAVDVLTDAIKEIAAESLDEFDLLDDAANKLAN